MLIAQAVRTCLAKYAEFGGRASRAEFWWFAVFVALLLGIAGTIEGEGSLRLGAVVGLAALPPFLAAAARRLRDAGLSPWWLLVGLVPFAGVPACLAMMALPGAAPRARGLRLS